MQFRGLMAPAQRLLIPQASDNILSDLWNFQLEGALKQGLMSSKFILNLEYFNNLDRTIVVHEVYIYYI